MANSKNYITEFGESQLPKKITNKKKERGHPLKENNSDAQANNWVEDGHDPHHFVKRFPDGTQMVIAWGKNPRVTLFHASGTSLNIYPDGTINILGSGNHNEMIKGGHTQTVEGHYDERIGGHSRHNIDGGQYTDVAGDAATHVAGNTAHHTVGNHSMNVSGNLNIKGNKQVVIGTQDDNGNLMMSMNMNNGRIQFATKGDMEFVSKSGAIKFKAPNISMNADNQIGLKSGGTLSVVAGQELGLKGGSKIKMEADQNIGMKTPIVLGPPPTGTGDKAPDVADGIASSQTSFNYSNTIKSS